MPFAEHCLYRTFVIGDFSALHDHLLDHAAPPGKSRSLKHTYPPKVPFDSFKGLETPVPRYGLVHVDCLPPGANVIIPIPEFDKSIGLAAYKLICDGTTSDELAITGPDSLKIPRHSAAELAVVDIKTMPLATLFTVGPPILCPIDRVVLWSSRSSLANRALQSPKLKIDPLPAAETGVTVCQMHERPGYLCSEPNCFVTYTTTPRDITGHLRDVHEIQKSEPGVQQRINDSLVPHHVALTRNAEDWLQNQKPTSNSPAPDAILPVPASTTPTTDSGNNERLKKPNAFACPFDCSVTRKLQPADFKNHAMFDHRRTSDHAEHIHAHLKANRGTTVLPDDVKGSPPFGPAAYYQYPHCTWSHRLSSRTPIDHLQQAHKLMFGNAKATYATARAQFLQTI